MGDFRRVRVLRSTGGGGDVSEDDSESEVMGVYDLGALQPEDLWGSAAAELVGGADLWSRLHLYVPGRGNVVTTINKLGEGTFGVAFQCFLSHGADEYEPVVVKVPPILLRKKGLLRIERGTGRLLPPEELDPKHLLDDLRGYAASEILNSQTLEQGIAAVSIGLEGEVRSDAFLAALRRRKALERAYGYQFLHKILDYALDPVPCVVSEWCDGTLEDLSFQDRGIWGSLQRPSDAFLLTAHRVVNGVEYMLGQGLAHGDLKPSNILYRWSATADGRKVPLALVADFGCLERADLFKYSLQGGTPLFLSPEYERAYMRDFKDTDGLLPRGNVAYSAAMSLMVLLLLPGLGAEARRDEHITTAALMHAVKTARAPVTTDDAVVRALSAVIRERRGPSLRYYEGFKALAASLQACGAMPADAPPLRRSGRKRNIGGISSPPPLVCRPLCYSDGVGGSCS